VDRDTLSIFENLGENFSTNCLVTSSYINDSDVIRNLKRLIFEKWGRDINNVVTIDGVVYSRNINDNEIILSIDDILDRINDFGFDNLTDSEKEFLKNIK